MRLRRYATLPGRTELSMAISARLFRFSIFVGSILHLLRYPSARGSDVSMVGHPTTVQISVGNRSEQIPTSSPGTSLVVRRVHIHGLSRFQNLAKYAHSWKLKVELSQTSPGAHPRNVEICFHRNASRATGNCSPGEWEKLKESWMLSISPFGDAFLEIRMFSRSSLALQVSTEEEYLWYRLTFLLLGFVLMALAPLLSMSIVFYYSSAMTIGIILVILMVLFQGMKLLPTGRKSSLAIVMYSSIVGVGSFLLHYISGLLRSALVEIGLKEDMFNPVAIFLLVILILAGAWLGFWGVRKLVLTEDGNVDLSIAQFVKWSIWIFSSVMILQSSLDTLLATEALVSSIVISAFTRRILKGRFLRHLYKWLYKAGKRFWTSNIQYPTSYESPPDYKYIPKNQRSGSESLKRRARPWKFSPYTTAETGITDATPHRVSETETFYSTFHDTPERRRFSREEWEAFTRDSTKRALQGLVASPDFTNWAIANADKITLTPEDVRGTRNVPRRWFGWLS
ncbi:hypothetical protein H6P81_020759 [Aristolochia fimbriata]|uniref:Uncharacterized protein n=1 Tax=Aristolochia fimbriata TaxID=158543 RepID=A0AAV7DWD2_ARIFI|nr:hypothetical protein H6P81_020759 [Aristolochia fimbriata]